MSGRDRNQQSVAVLSGQSGIGRLVGLGGGTPGLDCLGRAIREWLMMNELWRCIYGIYGLPLPAGLVSTLWTF